MRRASFWMLPLTYGCVGVRATAGISERTHAACRKTTCSSSKPRCKSSAAWAKRRKQGRRSAVTVFLGCIGEFASWTSARSVRWTTSSWAATRHALGVVQALVVGRDQHAQVRVEHEPTLIGASDLVLVVGDE